MTKTLKIRLGCALPLVATLTAGCATNTGTGAAAGAGAGGIIGAGVGAIVGGREGALLGAAVGAGAGAGAGALIGNYMDKQEKALKEVKGAVVERKGDKLVVRFSSAILFDSGKSELKAASQKDLTEFGRVLSEYKETDIVIEGHTDNTGKKPANAKLSLARAEAVAAFIQQQGVARPRLTTKGHADDRPIADNSTDAGRQQNRRVQIQIAANEKLQKDDAQAAQGSAQPAAKR